MKLESHFIMKKLAEKSGEQFVCLGENTEKYIAFTVPIEKEVKGLLKRKKALQKFIDSARFMASSLSNLINTYAEEIHQIKCKYGHDNIAGKTCGTKCKG